MLQGPEHAAVGDDQDMARGAARAVGRFADALAHRGEWLDPRDRLVFAPGGDPGIVDDALIGADIHLLEPGDLRDRHLQRLADDVGGAARPLQRAAADRIDAEMPQRWRGRLRFRLALRVERDVATTLALAGTVPVGLSVAQEPEGLPRQHHANLPA
jgi:hypothetical protein